MVEMVETELERSGRVAGFEEGDGRGRWIGMWYWDIVFGVVQGEFVVDGDQHSGTHLTICNPKIDFPN
jgi:hypothetical protein